MIGLNTHFVLLMFRSRHRLFLRFVFVRKFRTFGLYTSNPVYPLFLRRRHRLLLRFIFMRNFHAFGLYTHLVLIVFRSYYRLFFQFIFVRKFRTFGLYTRVFSSFFLNLFIRRVGGKKIGRFNRLT